MSGDTYRRKFNGDVAQCGCNWTRHPDYGDVLNLCPLHAEANRASLKKFERERAKRIPRAGG